MLKLSKEYHREKGRNGTIIPVSWKKVTDLIEGDIIVIEGDKGSFPSKIFHVDTKNCQVFSERMDVYDDDQSFHNHSKMEIREGYDILVWGELLHDHKALNEFYRTV